MSSFSAAASRVWILGDRGACFAVVGGITVVGCRLCVVEGFAVYVVGVGVTGYGCGRDAVGSEGSVTFVFRVAIGIYGWLYA